MKSTIISILFIVILGSFAFFYRDGLINLFYYFPCDHPINYTIGSVDARFDLSSDQFTTDVEEAANVWNQAEGKDLLTYDANAKLTISLIYDQRQQLTNQINSLDNTLQNEKNTLSPAMQAYKSQVQEFEQKMQDLNNQINYWNSKGGAPQDVYQKLIQQQKDLQQEADQLNQLNKSLNQSADVYNAQVGQLNQTVDSFDAALQIKPEEGLYNPQNNTIVIYFNNGHNELIHTLAHELGHALGMQHVAGKNSIMYYQTDSAVIPSANDMAELQRICQKEWIYIPIAENLHQLVIQLVDKIQSIQIQNPR